MKYFFNTRLGNTRYELADGSLLCKGVPIARTGLQVYGAEELPEVEPDEDGEIVVTRSEAEVFRPETLASFEGMTFTITHPDEMVNPSNWQQHAHGHVQNVRRGEGEQSDLMLADIVVKTSDGIEAIYNDIDEISCGYDAEYVQTGRGRADQTSITGNHVALVPNGRAGKRCSIGDSNYMFAKTEKAKWFDRLRRAVKTRDAEGLEEAMANAPSDLTNDDEGGSSNGLPAAININLAPAQPLPDKPPEMGGITKDDDMASTLAAILARLDKLEGGGTTDSDPDDKEDAEEAKKSTSDAAYHQDVIARAELLVPGVKLPEGGKLATFKRSVLDAAYRTDRGAQILTGMVGANPNFKTIPKPVLDSVFIAASEIAKAKNSPSLSFSAPTKDAKNTPAALNQTFHDFWNKKG